MTRHILTMSCADAPGIVHKVTGLLFSAGFNIVEQSEFVDQNSRHFFMRAELDGPGDVGGVKSGVLALGFPLLNLAITLRQKKRLVILAGKEAHCLGDLLIRYFSRDLDGELLSVISNHSELQSLVERFNIPFHCVPTDLGDRSVHETGVRELLEMYQPEVLVLAKYMRVLSPEFVRDFGARTINIHHSFLPAFIGAKPYHQAYERGVKIIGATAHYITEDLDQGPIIAQDVISVTHRHSVDDFQHAGHDIEKLVLARALRLVLDDRVFVHGNRTVVFD